jgi:ubiquinone/menaquinone biosynthesis C-methylase UbiE
MKNDSVSANNRACLDALTDTTGGERLFPLRLAVAPRPRVLESSPIHEMEESVEYDAMVRGNFRLLNRPFADILLKIGPEKARVLDIGTGPGRIPVELAHRRPNWEIWGVDMSEDMLAKARRHAAEAGVGARVHFVRGSAYQLPFDRGDFDLTASHYMMHHIERPAEMFNEAARVTRGGGRVVIKDLARQPGWKKFFLFLFAKHVMRYTRPQMRLYAESLDAALTFGELRAALKQSNLNMAQIKSFRGVDFIVVA